MIQNSSLKILCLLTICVYINILLNSCNKELFDSSVNKVGVKIRLKGTSYSTGDLNKNNSKGSSYINSDTTVEESQQIKLDAKGFTVQGTLMAVGRNNLLSKINFKKKSAAVSTVLDPNTAYRIVIYNEDESYLKSQDFIYGDEATISDLDGGKTYIFVAYSINTTDISELPDLINPADLDDVAVEVSNDHEYLMYYKTQLTVHYQQPNYLDVVFDHKFSQITTTVSINNSAYNNGARIKSIDPPTMSSEREKATLKLIDGSLTYGDPVLVGKVLTGDPIATLGVQTYSFDPLNIISDNVDDAVMSFPSFTISTGSTVGAFIDMVNENFDISNLNIKPGYRYNLNLNIVMPCVEKVEPSILYDFVFPDTYGNINLSPSIEFESSDYGVEFNIYKLDQSFQLLINNNPIFIREVEFEYFGYDPDDPDGDGEDMDDVRFVADDGRYNDDAAPPIYNLRGDAGTNKPIIRVIVDINGNVSLYGSRRSHNHNGLDGVQYGLEPLYLTNGNGFNQVTWSAINTNTVVLSQTSYGPTNISFNTVGYKKVACP